jgi:hypothetical protein
VLLAAGPGEPKAFGIGTNGPDSVVKINAEEVSSRVV